jgi:hypothetical protein
METTHRAGTVIAALVMTLSVGCAVDASDTAEEADAKTAGVAAVNGLGLNGLGLNGLGLNGLGLNGLGLNGLGLNGLGLNGLGLNGLGLNGSSLLSFEDNGGVVTGQSLVGAQFWGKLDDGSTGNFRIDALDVEDGDVHKYSISFEMNGTRHNLCGDQNGVPIRAVPLRGKWNYGDGVPGGGSKIENPFYITFACEGFALEKCVDFGYKPWRKVGGKSLDDHHQACTRMIRADYCGDGHPWTVNGTLINFYDKVGIQQDDASWPFEAEWDEDGARCLSHQRIQNMTEVPECSFDKTASKCGKSIKWNKTLIASEAP